MELKNVYICVCVCVCHGCFDCEAYLAQQSEQTGTLPVVPASFPATGSSSAASDQWKGSIVSGPPSTLLHICAIMHQDTDSVAG